ncbi:SAVED domain-containing protein [Novosphingobium guangzhouense]|uniref:SMODS-associated and fused to various effectors domain-containing protein n=1 Tax=Novosphingobium guangzhouense TaxID=1850347 RepID=A0A2K2FWU4_9SPHN|nr:SAVED domain-containing protein [Novosphingobium guangzhouense]PNU03243.1 hypothetical protein A8V01_24235 [Novosphingobium guangzhouense]
MANAVVAGWQGHDYQARFFWLHASALRDPDQTNVTEVSYEADFPKGFDDVVVRYDPPRPGSQGYRIGVHHYQIKYHVVAAGRFGYEDLVDPAFTGGTAVSILQRLREAKDKSPENAAFTLVTTDRIKDGDQLLDLLSNDDRRLRLDKLFVAGGDKSRMGRVRKLWCDHLGLSSDEELRSLLSGFGIHEGHASLEQMRDAVNDRFRVVGLTTCRDTLSFKYDGAAKQLKINKINNLTRDSFDRLCIDENWLTIGDPPRYHNIAIRSFSDGIAADLDSTADNRLSLLDRFDGRYLIEGQDWNTDLRPTAEAFIRDALNVGESIRLTINAHSSFAYLAGTVLNLKTGADVELVQKGRAPTSIWRADDGKAGPEATIETTVTGDGQDLALVVSLTRDAAADVADYVSNHLPTVGKTMIVKAAPAPSQSAICGGTHAAALADQVGEAVRAYRLPIGARVHVFATAPNGFLFFLGQQRAAMGPSTYYEYDFERRVHGTYEPTFRID